MKASEYEMMSKLEQTHWWFVGKQALVKSQLEGLDLKKDRRTKLLDVGCGTGLTLPALRGFGSAYGMEKSSLAIQLIKKENPPSVIQADAKEHLPFREEVFTVVTCLDVLEHVDDDFFLLKELLRVCRPGGYVFLTVPAFDLFWSLHDVALGHKRRYTMRQITDLLPMLPCKSIKTSYYNSIFSIPILIVRIFKRYISHDRSVRSDVFMPNPFFLNKILTILYALEIRSIKFLNFPFGVSLLLIVKKTSS